MICRVVGRCWRGPYATTDVRQGLPDRDDAAAVIVTGSPASVHHREPWMLATESWLRGAVARGTPLFGICFGHQLLAQALGGDVTVNPRGQERGTVTIEVAEEDPLLGASRQPFLANAWHDDTVIRPPAGAVTVARSARDGCQMLRLAPRAYGAQFHPEFDRAVLRSYVAARDGELTAAGHDVAALRSGIRETPDSAEVLRRFVALAAAGH